MLGIHIHGDSSQSIKPLQMALWPGGTTDIIQSPKDFEHSGKRERAHFHAQAFMGTEAKVSVQAHITVKADLVGIGKGNRVAACNNLYFARSISIWDSERKNEKGHQITYQVADNLLASFQSDPLTVIVNHRWLSGKAWQRHRASESRSFHKAVSS